MDARKVYVKTAKGQEEIRSRACHLDARHRALLIVVDGHRSIGDLSGLVTHPADIEAMLMHLVELGLIAPPEGAPGTPAPVGTSAGQGGGAPEQDWQGRCEKARGMVLDLLGPMGEDLAMKLESVKSAEELEQALTHIREVIRNLRGKNSAAHFANALGMS